MLNKQTLLKKSIQAALAVSTLAAVSALAQTPPTPAHTFTGNVGLFSQYIFRGLTQTDRRPALQGGFDYAHASGLYAGVWGSNVSWISDFAPGVSASLELDTYLGFKKNFINDDWTYDIGFLRYNYPGNYHGLAKADTDEIYGAVSWKWVTFKFSNSLGDTFGVTNAKNTYYADLTAAVPLPSDLTLTLHAGKQKFKGNGNDDFSYNDYKVELAWAFAKDWAAGAGYTDTNAKTSAYTPVGTDRFIGDSQGYVFVKKTF